MPRLQLLQHHGHRHLQKWVATSGRPRSRASQSAAAAAADVGGCCHETVVAHVPWKEEKEYDDPIFGC
jgi:hypothetical protein